MTYKITYYRYNNKDFCGISFAETEQEAIILADKLSALKHITSVCVTEVS